VLTEETPAETASFRLSPQQEQLWRAHPDGPRLGVRCTVDVGAADPAAVRDALAHAVGRHEILRTTFARREGLRLPGQLIHERLQPSWAAETTLDVAEGPVVHAALDENPGGGRTLTITVAAVCADARSLALLAAELQAELGGNAGDATEPLQYADYAEWRAESLAAAEETWDVDGGSAAPALPFADGLEASGALPARIAVELDAAAVVRGAEACHVTPAVFAQGCWHALLARLSGDAGALVGTVFDGRAQAELAEAVGPYAQVLPIATTIEESTTMAEVVDQVRRARARLEQNQDTADGESLERIASRCPIGFSTLDVLPATGVLELVGPPTPVLVQLTWLDDGVEPRADLHVSPEFVAAGGADLLARTFAALVTAAADHVDTPIADLSLTTGSTTGDLSSLDGPPTRGGETTVTRLFEEIAARSPDAVAVVAPDDTLTYAELDARANRLAHRLRELGIGRDSAVGLCMERSANSIVGLLGVLKAGGAYVPLNFEHPAARLAHQLAETNAPVLLTESGVSDRLPRFDGVVLQVDDRESLGAAPDVGPDPVNEPDDLVYVMYTSGSTGLPKGVAVTHRNLAAYATGILDRLELSGTDGASFAAVSALSTDLGNTSVFAALLGGGTLHLVSPADAMDGARFAEYSRKRRIDVLKITPSHLRAILDAGGPAGVLPRRWLVLGGEALPWELLERVRSASPTCRIINHYGPTEATVGSCAFEAGSAEPRGRTVPIGRPLPGDRVYVVDRRLRLLPVGVPGELCIGGVGVARGYVEQPEQTAERFLPDPFAAGGSEQIYRTGDRVRMLADGNVEFLGRVDDQVKIHGHRVEPSEIEVVLSGHPSVRQCAVVALDAGEGEKHLVAYVAQSGRIASEELQSFARAALPVHMVPARFVALDALPLTASGKIDRRSLPDPGEDTGAEYVAPRTPLEEALAAIWQDLLGVERVGVHDDFFALGGHSLLATQAVIRIRSAIGDVPLHSLFNAPTVAALAESIVAAEQEAERAATADQAS
jgi:amino acid adenylation domain-containing protein